MKKIFLILIMTVCTVAGIFSIPSVKAMIDSDNYLFGQQIIVAVKLERLESLSYHGIYFKLAYDGTILSYEGLDDGELILSESNEKDFLYAVTDRTTSVRNGNSIVISYAMIGDKTVTKNEGVLCYLKFRVTGEGNYSSVYNFNFQENSRSMEDAEGNLIFAEWMSSGSFTIGDRGNKSYFIKIKDPYVNQVYYSDTAYAKVNAIMTNGTGFKVILSNAEYNYKSKDIISEYGSISGIEVPITSGFNNIKAELFNSNNDKLAEDVVRIFRSGDDKFIKILSPVNNILVNTDSIKIDVASTYPDVTINGYDAADSGEKYQSVTNIYTKNIWLKKGFNRISAAVKSPQGPVYKDTINVYYEKDDSIFKFTTPYEGEIFKEGISEISIKGEISSLKNDDAYNTVHVSAIYHPKYGNDRKVFTNKTARIAVSDIQGASAPYMFIIDDKISLKGYESGELEIIAYKNKLDGKCENEIHRYVYIDNNRLSIDLIQPNIYNEDLLDSEEKVYLYNRIDGISQGRSFDGSSIEIDQKGGFTLKTTNTDLGEISLFSGKKIVDMVQSSDKTTLYLMYNDKGTMYIFKKTQGKWSNVVKRSDMFGYKLCITSQGLFVGVSNLFTNKNTGLYLLKDGELINIVINQPIPHVQFIINKDGNIFLYGNNYSHLYSFNIFSLMENEDKKLHSDMSKAIPFDNKLEAAQFDINDDLSTAYIRSTEGKTYFYRYNNGEFVVYNLSVNGIPVSDKVIANIAYARYNDGNYNAYLLTGEEGLFTVMENKYNGELFCNKLQSIASDTEQLLGMTAVKNEFAFIIGSSGAYRVEKGYVLFDAYYRTSSEDYSSGIILGKNDLSFFITDTGVKYVNLYENGILRFYKLETLRQNSGDVNFAYENQDAEGLKAFSFLIAPEWVDNTNDKLQIGFAAFDRINNRNIMSVEKKSINEFLKEKSDLFAISCNDNEDKKIVRLEFNELMKDVYLKFDIGLKSEESLCPEIWGFTVYKKIIVKVQKTSSDILEIPVKGFVKDLTVKEVNINSNTVTIERDRSFSYVHKIRSDADETKIDMDCKNSNGDIARLNFIVKIVDSSNDLWNIGFKDSSDDALGFDTAVKNLINTDKEIFKISGNYYGLVGVIAGYELSSYISDDGTEKLVTVGKGLFNSVSGSDSILEKSTVLPADWGAPSGITEKPGYEYYRFANQKIKLYPGKNRLIIYVENPGGYRNEYKVDIVSGEDPEYPDIVYNIPGNQEKIIFTNAECREIDINFPSISIPFRTKLPLMIKEVDQSGDMFKFIQTVTINGEVKASSKIFELKVDNFDLNKGLKILNSDENNCIKVDDLGRFSISARIEMDENAINDTYRIGITPTAPYLVKIKTGIIIYAEKDFENTNIIPDFSPMDEVNWKNDELTEMKKNIAVKFTRFIPEFAWMKFIINYNNSADKTIYGKILKLNKDNTNDKNYRIVDVNNEPLSFARVNGLKYGFNRIQWIIMINGTNKTISSSFSGNPDMNDFILNLEKVEAVEFKVDFNVESGRYYNQYDLPSMYITKQENSNVVVQMNEKTILDDTLQNYLPLYLSSLGGINEGWNNIKVAYKSVVESEQTREYSFLYDSMSPGVTLKSYKYNDTNTTLLSVSAMVTESNINNVSLYYNNARIDATPAINQQGDGIYEVIWTGLDYYKLTVIDPYDSPDDMFDRALYIEAEDKAGNKGRSEDFKGLKTLDRMEQKLFKINIDNLNYPFQKSAPFYNSDLTPEETTPAHAKFYAKNFDLSNDESRSVSSMNINRPGYINVNFKGSNSTVINLKAREKIILSNGFRSGSTFSSTVDSTTNYYIVPYHDYIQTHNEKSNSMSIVFWYRQEEYSYYPSIGENEYKCILNLYENGNERIFIGYGADKYISLVLMSDENYDAIPVTFVDSGWNQIIVNINPMSYTISVKDRSKKIDIPYSDILNKGGQFYFGDINNPDKMGHFSIRKPFYMNNNLTYSDVQKLLTNIPGTGNDIPDIYPDEPALDPNDSLLDIKYVFRFDDGNSDVHKNFDYKLRPNRDSSKWFVNYENSDFTQVNSGSFMAISIHRNLINNSFGINFQNSSSVCINTVYESPTDGVLRITTQESGSYGKYFFGSSFGGNGSYGLKQDKYYSAAGEVLDLNGEIYLVMKVNDVEQRMKLEKGDFHFVYKHDNTIPKKVDLYIELNDKGAGKSFVELNKTMKVNNGNFILPQVYMPDIKDQSTFASTKYMFQNSGTVSFWYKPMINNDDGFVNYDITMFDSDIMKIGARTDVNGISCFYARYGTNSSNYRILQTNVPVREGWQYVQLTYEMNGSNSCIYFYINDQIAYRIEGDQSLSINLPYSGGYPVNDNVILGSDFTGDQFAEGYLDDVTITGLPHKNLFEERNPVIYKYSNIDYELQLKNNLSLQPSAFTEMQYSLVNKSANYKNVNKSAGLSDFPMDCGNLPGGKFSFASKMKINSYNYEKTFNFILDQMPLFSVKGTTPFILYNKNNDVTFDIVYDDNHTIESNLTKYSGFILQLQIDGDTADYIVVQDFINKNTYNWIMKKSGSTWSGEGIIISGNRMKLSFKNINLTEGSVIWNMYPFYFSNAYEDSNTYTSISTENGYIGGAQLTSNICYTDDADAIQYKLELSLANYLGTNDAAEISGILKKLEVKYDLTNQKDSSIKYSGSLKFEGNNMVSLFYDDIFKDDTEEKIYGQYDVKLGLYYQGGNCANDLIVINKQKSTKKGEVTPEEKSLEIKDFSVLFIDKNNNKVKLLLKFDQNAIEQLSYKYTVYEKNTPKYNGSSIISTLSKDYVIIDDVPISSDISRVNITLYENNGSGLSCESELFITNSRNAPEVHYTNEPATYIGYNNVFFTWRGYVNDVQNEDIQYSYNFDNNGWSTPDSNVTRFEVYNLKEEWHSLKVKAIYYGIESNLIVSTFFVDTVKPVFDKSRITCDKITVANGICTKIRITGSEGAINDSSLVLLSKDGVPVVLGKNGSFIIDDIELEFDGINSFLLTAYDNVGNFTDYTVNFDNTLTTIIYPYKDQVQYAPMTVVGKIDEKITSKFEIYLFDALSENKGSGDYTGWKKAKINEDRIFFIDDIFVNPGTKERESGSTIKMCSVLPGGKTFTKIINVKANEIIKPIEMKLSSHSEQGESANINVGIECSGNVPDISSWSIDFNGDGIYDIVDMVDNPQLGKSHKWNHSYSSMGLIKPRVRIITSSGGYFTATDQIIIHEKIIESSNLTVKKPVGLSIIDKDGGAKKLLVLSGEKDLYTIDFFEIKKNDNQLTRLGDPVSLEGYGIKDPVSIKAYDQKSFFIAYNKNGSGMISMFRENDFGNYMPAAEISDSSPFAYMDADNKGIYATYKNDNSILFVPVKDGMPDVSAKIKKQIDLKDQTFLGNNAGISKSAAEIFISDYFNQRIIRLSDNLDCIDYFGSFGTNQGEFIKPSVIRSYQNRIFTYDSGKFDIQIMDDEYNLITTLKHSDEPGYENYIEKNCLIDLADMGVITKEEDGKVYYYILILSRSSEKISMLKLPEWEELRAKVRNNKIVFLKNEEVLVAKPNGCDLGRLISSDALPKIEGKLDYPALSPDGKTLVFTSRTVLYNGLKDTENNNEYLYDNLYVIDVDGGSLKRIPLGIINEFEIERPVFNSNGNKIIFSAKKSGLKWQIYEYDFTTGTIGQIFSSNENARFPYYSPDDRFIAFTSDYDGDEEIELFDTQNPSVRVSVTSNNCRDSYPVWNTVYPFEITNNDLKIESKLAFVSERNYHKGVYYVYLSRKSQSDIRVVKKDGNDIGDRPDMAAIEVTSNSTEGDYPAFTGDGKNLVYEHYDGKNQILKKYNYESKTSEIMNLPKGSSRPAGMKNMISNFNVEPFNGNEVKLTWTRYTDQDLPYHVRYMKNAEGQEFVEKKVYTQNGTTLQGLDMGVEYLFKTCIIENGEEVTSSQWKKVKIPEVAARPSYTIDPNNPYYVNLTAWKPTPETQWLYSWRIDGQDITFPQNSQNFGYEFATKGKKYVVLKASNSSNTFSSVSEPMLIDIASDIIPVIEYKMSENAGTLTLDAGNSKGSNIDWAKTVWNITGGVQPQIAYGPNPTVSLDNFKSVININLVLKKNPVNGISDEINKNIIIDLDFKEIKPVITYEVDKQNGRLIRFSGENSLGNIDWSASIWTIFADAGVLYQEKGVSTISYQFPENNNKLNYSVSLTVMRSNDGMTKTSSIIVGVDEAPIEPKIDYEIITLKDGMSNITGAKVVFSCSNSRGSNIDFSQAKWVIPTGNNNEQTVQVGPTAVYNILGTKQYQFVKVNLTLSRRNGTDVKEVTEEIVVNTEELPEPEIRINKSIETTNSGNTIFLDVLSSKAPNIDWEKTEWLINENYTLKGPSARFDIPESSEDVKVQIMCTVYFNGGTSQMKKKEFIDVNKSLMSPFIEYKNVKSSADNTYQLSVLNTEGTNIDWEKTIWSIYDGNENVVQKQGAKILHAFMLKSQQMGYPVMVQMYKKGSTTPYYGYASIDVAGDTFEPIIYYNPDDMTDPNIITFSAEKSIGSNIDWQNAKWTFGDGSEYQYGPSAVKKYSIDSLNKEYTVSLSLSRRLTNGQTETKTVYKKIKIGKDEVKPVITAAISGNTLILSSDKSEGHGLLLDRSYWLFQGDGDTVNASEGKVDGTSESISIGYQESGTVGVSAPPMSGGQFMSATLAANQNNTNAEEHSINSSEAFSSSNIHTGAICRKTINSEKSIWVTLFVYRFESDGSLSGKYITRNIRIDEAKKGYDLR